MTNKMTTALVLAIACVLCCNPASRAEESLKKDDRIVFLGDSVTAQGMQPSGYVTLTSQAIANGYPDLNVEVIGAGRGGHKVPDCQRRLDTDVLQKNPTIVVIYIGINDVWHWTHPKVVARGKKGTTPEDFESGLKDMIGKINGAGARVILCTPTVIGEKTDGSNAQDEMLDQYSEISRKVAKETSSQLLDLRKAFLAYLKQHNSKNAEKGILTIDSVHMNEAGNQLLSELVLDALHVPAVHSTADAARQPNIVHILTDDLGWQDVAAYYRAVHGKESIYETPNMDRLVSNGLRFMQAYSPSATCAPSRAAYMAGQYTPHTGVLHVNGSKPPTPFQSQFQYVDGYYPMRLALDKPTVAEELKKAGYLTGHIKKWHIGGRSNGYPGPTQYGFDFSWTPDKKDYNDPDVWDKTRKFKTQYWNGLWSPLNPRHKGFATADPNDPFRINVNDDDRPLDGVTELAVRWLGKAKDQKKPFFLNLCPSLVHGPISTRDRKRLAHYCQKMGLPFPENPGKVTEKEWGQVNPYYASMIDGLDWSIGKVLTFLEATDDPRNPGHKLIDNTYLIVTSDNGAAEGKFGTKERVADNSPLREGKSTVYEGGLRVPVMVQGPGIKAGSVSDTPINLIDLFPTFLHMAGAEPGAHLELDGCNILPIMKGAATEAKFADGRVRDTLYFTLPVGTTSSSAIRKNGWKLVLNHTPEHNGRPAVELFKLYNEDGSVSDLSETKNLADTQPEKRDELLKALNAWFKKYDTQLPYKNAHVSAPGEALPGADKTPGMVKLVEKGNKLEARFETGSGKSSVVSGILVYTTNGSDLLRDNPNFEEWFRAPATVADGVATAIAPPGMTHAIFCLRDENGFLVQSKATPPYVGPGGDRRWTIARNPSDAYAWRPGLISLINVGRAANRTAHQAGLDTAALRKSIQQARGILEQPVEEKSYALAMRNLRREIRALNVAESKDPDLNHFQTKNW